MTVAELTIPGSPAPKKRPRGKQGQRAYTPRETVEAEKSVKWELLANRVRPVAGDVAVTLRFYTGPNDHDVDMDNLEKLVLDACNKIAYADDSQVVEKHTYLQRGDPEPRTELRIEERTSVTYEYELVVDYGGRDGVEGISHVDLGLFSKENAIANAREMLREHARRVEVRRRPVAPWETVWVSP